MTARQLDREVKDLNKRIQTLEFMLDAESIVDPKEFKKEVMKLREQYFDNAFDPEIFHKRIDDLMFKTLKVLGYKEGIEIIAFVSEKLGSSGNNFSHQGNLSRHPLLTESVCEL